MPCPSAASPYEFAVLGFVPHYKTEVRCSFIVTQLSRQPKQFHHETCYYVYATLFHDRRCRLTWIYPLVTCVRTLRSCLAVRD